MSSQIPILSLIKQSGPVAIVVLIILGILSLFLWSFIISKLLSNRKKNNAFKNWFTALRTARNLEELQDISNKNKSTTFGRISRSALSEIESLPSPITFGTLGTRTDLVEQAMERAVDREVYSNDKYLSFLALCSGVAPFLGLFGTVWGIMHSFVEIGNMGSANITVVAPGIAEALITTIVGLSVAIPATAAYNYFVTFNRQSATYMEDFASEILSLFRKGDLRNIEIQSPTQGS